MGHFLIKAFEPPKRHRASKTPSSGAEPQQTRSWASRALEFFGFFAWTTLPAASISALALLIAAAVLVYQVIVADTIKATLEYASLLVVVAIAYVLIFAWHIARGR